MSVFNTLIEKNTFINQLKQVYQANEAPKAGDYYKFSDAKKARVATVFKIKGVSIELKSEPNQQACPVGPVSN